MRRLQLLTIALLSLFIFVNYLWAERARGAVLFLTIGPGARAAGMGESFIAVANDPTATYWNPAGLGKFPLSSRWHNINFPDTGVKAVAPVKTLRSDKDFRKYDLWIATDNSLRMLRRDKWLTGEKYTVVDPEGREIKSILEDFMEPRSYDTSYISRDVLKKIRDYNELLNDSVPEGTSIEIPFKIFVPEVITALAGGDNVLYVGTKLGAYKYSSGVWRKLSGKNSPEKLPIVSMSVDNRNNLWVATPEGLFAYRGNKWSKYSAASGLPSSSIRSVYAKSPREVWISTKRGVVKFDGSKWLGTYHYYLAGTVKWENVVKDICGVESTQRLEALTSQLKAANNNPQNEKPPSDVRVPFDLPFSSEVKTIYMDSRDNVWFGTDLGLIRFDGKRFKVFGWRSVIVKDSTTIQDWVKAKWPHLSSTEITQTTQKLRDFGYMNKSEISAGETIEIPASPASGEIYDISEGFIKGDMLVSTEYGLMRYHSNLGQFRYILAGNLKDKIITHIITSGNEYWFADSKEMTVYSQGIPGLSLMHVKWLPELADDIYYEYFSGVYYLEEWGTVGGAITYISLGQSKQTNEWGEEIGGFYSYEMALSASYGAKIFPNFYAGLNFKFIYSALAPQIYVGHEKKSGTGSSFALDFGIIYDTPLKGLVTAATVQHLGPDIHYIDAAQADPLPRNLRVGLAYQAVKTDYHSLITTVDIEKEIIKFKDPDNPWSLEWHYAVKHLGFEYTYANFFSVRGGYIIDYDYYPKKESVENTKKPGYIFNTGDYIGTNYYTFGLGLQYGKLLFDFAYIPKVSDPENIGCSLPLSDIMRLSVTAQF